MDRDAARNDYRDLLVLTETIEADADVDAYLKTMEAKDIYRLDLKKPLTPQLSP